MRDVSAGLARFQGFPTRQRIVLIRVPAPLPEPAAKLPPPVFPRANLPSHIEIENQVVPADIEKDSRPAPAPEGDAEALRQTRIKSERARLNNNALVWQRERAAGGSATAQRSLAFRYLTGDGVDKDHARGMDLLRKAAVGGDSAAQKELAKREPAKKE